MYELTGIDAEVFIANLNRELTDSEIREVCEWANPHASPIEDLKSLMVSAENRQPKSCFIMTPKMYDWWMRLFTDCIPFYEINGHFVHVI